MTHSTPQPVGDRLKHGPLSGQNLALLKAGESVLRHLRTGEIFDLVRIKPNGFPTGMRGSWEQDHSPALLTYIGERDADGWVHAPEGGWTENPVPGMEVEVRLRSQDQFTGSDLSDDGTWKHIWGEGDIIAFRPATTPATREDGASGADGERTSDMQDGDASDHEMGRACRKWNIGTPERLAEIMLERSALRPLSPDQPSARERRLEEALAKAVEAVSDAIEWDKQRGYRMPYRVRDPLYAVLSADQALAHNQEGGR